jgi:ribonuclease-3
MNNLDLFCQRIEYQFNNKNLLIKAITHPSFNKDKNERNFYQRLEFLGDKVLSLIISDYLFKNFTEDHEGLLSKKHANFVSGEALASIAIEIGLDQVLQVSYGEEKLGGKNNKKNLENTLEALVGAIYLDSDYSHAKDFVLKFWKKYLMQDNYVCNDVISQLQELVQASNRVLPIYNTTKEGGLDHAPIFISCLNLPNIQETFQAKGSSKKEAQKNVAKIALDYLKNNQILKNNF